MQLSGVSFLAYKKGKYTRYGKVRTIKIGIPGMEALERLDRIEAKVGQFILKIQQVNRMNEALVRENQQLQLELLERDKLVAGLKELLRDMEQKNTRMKADEAQRTASVQRQLEQSVRQLNACIEQLRNL
jgi:hypothetical protein